MNKNKTLYIISLFIACSVPLYGAQPSLGNNPKNPWSEELYAVGARKSPENFYEYSEFLPDPIPTPSYVILQGYAIPISSDESSLQNSPFSDKSRSRQESPARMRERKATMYFPPVVIDDAAIYSEIIDDFDENTFNIPQPKPTLRIPPRSGHLRIGRDVGNNHTYVTIIAQEPQESLQNAVVHDSHNSFSVPITAHPATALEFRTSSASPVWWKRLGLRRLFRSSSTSPAQ